MTRPRWRTWCRRLALVACGLLLACFVLELVLRTTDEMPIHRNPLRGFVDPDPQLGWVGTPDHLARFHNADFDVVIAQDAEGFRLAEPAFVGPTDAPRVVLLGDSYGWGWGVSQGAVCTDVLQRRLGDRYRVVNRALAGFGTGQQLIQLRERVLPTAPHRLVLLFCANDVFDSKDSKRGTRPYHVLLGDRLAVRNQPVAGTITGSWRRFRRHSRALSFLAHQWNLVRDRLRTRRERAAGERPAKPAEPDAAVCEALLVEMQRLCATASPPVDFVVVYVTCPFDVTGVHGRTSPVREAGVRRFLQRVARERGITLLDPTDAFRVAWRAAEPRDDRGQPLFFPNDGHWTARGHEVAALALLADLAW